MPDEKIAESVKIEIEIYQDGQLSIKSPILGDTVTMLGILEMCKATVFQYKANQAKIVKPHVSLLNRVRGKF